MGGVGKKQQQNPLRFIRSCRRIVIDVITITTYAYLAIWLWQWNREYISSVRNNMTMSYGHLCLAWSPRLSPRSVIYSIFVIGIYGWIIQWMWSSVNRDWLWVFCRFMSIVFGGKSIYNLYWLIMDFVWTNDVHEALVSGNWTEWGTMSWHAPWRGAPTFYMILYYSVGIH